MKNLKKNLVFTGFMGVGKSYIAKEIAKESGFLFIDTDNMIESHTGLQTKEIFSKYEEKYFRNLEQKVFEFLKPTNKVCISVGGGFGVHLQSPLQELGLVIYIQKPLEEIIAKLDKEEVEKRPLLHNMQDAMKLYNQRIDTYKQQADIVIDISGLSFENSIIKVKRVLSKFISQQAF